MPPEFSYFEKLEELNTILGRHGNRPSALEDLAKLLGDADVRRDFFDRLNSTEWIGPLQQGGFFDRPPGIIRVDEKHVSYPVWPESRFLTRMAKESPNQVSAIFVQIETDNPSVISNILDAVEVMPIDVAVSLVPVICRAAIEGTLWIHFKEASDFCVRLAAEGKIEPAMSLGDALFTPTFEEGQEQPSSREQYSYREGIEKVAPVLAVESPHEFLPKLCDWLKASIEAKEYAESETGYDLSHAWRPAIEEHGQNHDYDFAGVMVGFVREGFELAIRSEKLSLRDALQIIEHYPYLVYKRLRLHLIGDFAEQSPDLCREEILNPDLFDAYEYKHEYAMLVGRRFNVLSAEQKEEWFDWVDVGPDMSHFDEQFKAREEREPKEEDRESRIDYWKFKKLHWVRAYLEGGRRDFYNKMLAKHGEPVLADLNVYTSSGHWAPESPMTVEELSEMTFEQAVDAVSSWRPDKPEFGGPDVEGLASTFGQYVATSPVSFSAQAERLVECPAIFVRKYISLMSEAVQAGQEIDLPAVLKLCSWAVSRPVAECTTPEQEDESLVDKNWQWTRDEISRLIENICQATSENKPKYALEGYREPIWQLIEALCQSEATSYVVRDTSEEDPRVHDYANLGINSPQGKAVEAALAYARWVANHIKKVEGGNERIPNGFDSIPEVRELLEFLIESPNRSFEVLAMIGSRIGLIYWIDKDWTTNNAEQIFRLKGIEVNPPQGDGWAAWNAFLLWVNPHIAFYRALKSQYAYAVEQAANVTLPEPRYEQPMNRLGEHLIVLYGRGQLDLDDDEGLLRKFVVNSIPEIRRHAITFVGQWLDGDEEVPKEVTERFMSLWDVYWAGPGKGDAEEDSDRRLFGNWFSCGKFPAQWSLDRLEQYVEIARLAEPLHDVAEQLANVAPTDPLKAVRILDAMVRGDRGGWFMHGWVDSAAEILKTSMKAGGDAREISIELIDYLGRRGYMQFGELLNKE